MFVEIVRFFIVLLATAAGYRLGLGDAQVPETNGPIIGATLGACVGYVAGGVFGRLLNSIMGNVERSLEHAPAAQLLAGSIGGLALGGLGSIVTLPVVFAVGGFWGWPVLGLVTWCGIYLGWRIATRKAVDLLALAGLSTRPLVRATPYGPHGEADAVLLDTSAIIDGRMLAVVRAGFLRDALLVPRFVLEELQGIADHTSDQGKRVAGLRGLETLDALNKIDGVQVHVLDDTVPDAEEVDAKLVTLAKRLQAGLVTVDVRLQKVAELQGVRCLNLTKLSDGLRPASVPGDLMTITIAKVGREPGQGVGYSDEGTMVVVADAAELVGQEVRVRVTSKASTAVGQILFATPA